MKLKDVRKIGIQYCENNNCSYTYISHDNTNEFYLTEDEDKHTVFLVNRNGSLDAFMDTNYAVDFHKELKRRRNNKRNNGKRRIADMYNSQYEDAVG